MIENGPKWRRRRRLTRDDEDPEGATEGRKDGRTGATKYVAAVAAAVG